MSFIKSFWPLAHARQALVAIGLVAFSVGASAQSIVVASTTSTEQSGLFGYLLPEFKKASGIDVKVVALGTGQALDTARRGDADAVFVHDVQAEQKFVAEGFGVKRYPVMYNDFILVGHKFFFGHLVVDEEHVGIAPARHVQRLAGAHGHHFDVNAAGRLERGQQVREQARLLGGRGGRHVDALRPGTARRYQYNSCKRFMRKG